MNRRPWLLAAAALIPACGGSGSGSGTGGGSGQGHLGVPPIGQGDPPPASWDPPPATYEDPGTPSDPSGTGGSCLACTQAFECSETGSQGSYSLQLEPAQSGQGCAVSGVGSGFTLACGGELFGQACSARGCVPSEIGTWREGGDGTLTICAELGERCLVCTPSEGGAVAPGSPTPRAG
jgi:hypothetical protein